MNQSRFHYFDNTNINVIKQKCFYALLTAPIEKKTNDTFFVFDV